MRQLALARFRAIIRCCIQCCLVEINTKDVARTKGPGDDGDGAGEQGELPREAANARRYSCACLCIVVLAHPSTERMSMAIVVT